MTLWTPSVDWRERHTTADLVYRVRLAAPTARDADALWALLTAEHTVGDEGDVYDGGAAIHRAGDRELDVVSGGEDALESLEQTINDTLADAARRAGNGVRLAVVAEERRAD